MDKYLFQCNSTELCFIVPTGTKREDWSRAAVWTGTNQNAGAQELARLNGWPMTTCPACSGVGCDLCNWEKQMSVQRATGYEKKRKRAELE